MEAGMRERKKEATKANILSCAIDLINENGFADTTMQMIAEKADVALRTLYNYFPSKESIVATYIREEVWAESEKSWDRMMELDTTYERLLFICRKSEWMRNHVVLTEVYASDPRNYCYGPPNDEIPRSGLDEIVLRVIETGRQQNDVTVSVPAEVLTRQFMGFYYFSIMTWLSNPHQDLFEIFREGLDILYRGIKAESADVGTVLWGMFC
jgi:AcrR family transcriptional regulator